MSKNEFESQSIIFATLIKEAEEKILKFKSIGLNMKTYEDRLNDIKGSILNPNKENPIISKNIVSRDENDKNKSYDINNSKLKDLIQELSKYEEYYLMVKKAEYLSSQLKDNELLDADYLISAAVNLLKRIELIPLDDYANQEKIINISYETIYNILKLESLTSSNILKEEIKENKIHSYNIAKLIEDECNTLNNRTIFDRINYLESESMDKSIIIDSKLLRLIAVTYDENYVNQIKEKIITNYNNYLSIKEELKSTAASLETKTAAYENKKEKNLDDFLFMLKRVGVITASLGTSVILSVSAYFGLAEADKKYLTKNIVYNLETGETSTSEDWERLSDYDVIVEVENPWEIKKSGKYKKTRDYYKFKSLSDNKDPENYIKMIEDKSINRRKTEESIEKPENFENDETKYKVLFKEYTDEYLESDEKLICGFMSMLTFLVLALSSILLYAKVFSTEDPIDDLDYAVKTFLDDIEYKIEDEKAMKEYIQKIYELINKCNELNDILKKNPAYAELCPEISTILEDLKAETIIDQYAPSANKKRVLKAMH